MDAEIPTRLMSNNSMLLEKSRDREVIPGSASMKTVISQQAAVPLVKI